MSRARVPMKKCVKCDALTKITRQGLCSKCYSKKLYDQKKKPIKTCPECGVYILSTQTMCERCRRIVEADKKAAQAMLQKIGKDIIDSLSELEIYTWENQATQSITKIAEKFACEREEVKSAYHRVLAMMARTA